MLLASAWCVLAAAQCLAGRPVDPSEKVPLPELDGFDRILLAASPSAAAQDEALTDVAAAPALKSKSESVVVNLINRLVQRGVLTKEDSTELMAMAEKDASDARQQETATQEAVVQLAVTQAVTAAQTAAPPPDALPTEGAVRVTFIPEVVKKEMREQIKQEVMAQAKEENWIASGRTPELLQRFRVFGDIRIRAEADRFPNGNDNTGAFPNFNAINTGAPFDVSGTVFSPQINVDAARQRIRLRARLGVAVDLTEGFSVGLRIATGENNSPVTTNQSLGLANGAQGGNFSKYAIWLDRAFIRYEAGGLPNQNLAIMAGRFDNPFFSTDIIWDEDVGFDGAALTARYEVAKCVTPFVAAGAFPVFNTDFNFSSNRPDKFASDDKYLYGGQIGADVKPAKGLSFRGGVSYYYFDNVEGRLSDPYTPQNAQDAGNTDNTRPAFAQKGNTYRPLRNIVPNASNNFGTSNQFQYFGLATRFENLALTGKLTYDGFDPVRVTLSGEYVKNLAFRKNDIEKIAVNNRGPTGGINGAGAFAGGDTAWIVGLNAGTAEITERGHWSLGVNYRHVESDAVIDGFNDSDFGLGGTNVKGFTLSGAVGISKNVSLGLRWFSADSIAGPPAKNDVILLDLSAKF